MSTWDKVANKDNVDISSVSTIARQLIDHLHRWTRSESYVLYDPALSRFLGWFIRKVFGQLIA